MDFIVMSKQNPSVLEVILQGERIPEDAFWCQVENEIKLFLEEKQLSIFYLENMFKELKNHILVSRQPHFLSTKTFMIV